MADDRADVATHPLPTGERLIVTIGVMAERTPCLNTTVRSPSPIARAVRL